LLLHQLLKITPSFGDKAMKNMAEKWSWWEKIKALVEGIVTNTPFEPIARWLWWEIRTVGRPRMRRALKGQKQIGQVMSRLLGRRSNCVDIGCHKGHILRYILEFAPDGHHLAFEPIPELAKGLREKFPHVDVYELALGDFMGESTFFHVVSRPGRSGFRKQKYPRPNETVKEIRVKSEKLDNIIPKDLKVDFIKVDVEGAEFLVFCGAIQTIKRDRPYILFEHGRAFAASYGYTSEMVYDVLVQQCSLNISFMPDWLYGKGPLSRSAFVLNGAGDYLAHP
jgi:FkbM family methyltransferase